MKMVILTALWKRPALTEIFLSYYSNMKERLEGQIDLKLVAVGSEGLVTEKISKDNGWKYVEAPNNPVSQKWNAGVKSLKDIDADAVIILGSDDFISDNLLLEYKKRLNENYALMGVKDMYVLDVPTERFGRWRGYQPNIYEDRTGETIGMARCIGRKVMEMVDYDIWLNIGADFGLDGIMSSRFKSLALAYCSESNAPLYEIKGDSKIYKWGHVGYYLSDLESVGVDIKTSTNITSLDMCIRSNPLCMEWIEDAERFFSENLPHLNFQEIMTASG